jgi:hypothetical protein
MRFTATSGRDRLLLPAPALPARFTSALEPSVALRHSRAFLSLVLVAPPPLLPLPPRPAQGDLCIASYRDHKPDAYALAESQGRPAFDIVHADWLRECAAARALVPIRWARAAPRLGRRGGQPSGANDSFSPHPSGTRNGVGPG